MAKELETPFKSYELTASEETAGKIFSIPQKLVLHNLLFTYAMEKLNLKYDPNEPMVFMQTEAELQGQINLLQFLLDESDATETQAAQPTIGDE